MPGGLGDDAGLHLEESVERFDRYDVRVSSKRRIANERSDDV